MTAEELNLGGLVCVREDQLHAATRTDGLARARDRMPEISRGHSRWIQAGEGLKALQSERRSERINRAVASPKARTVPGDEPGKWSGK